MKRTWFANAILASIVAVGACPVASDAQDPKPNDAPISQAPRRPGQRPDGRRPGEARPGEARPGAGPANPELAARGMAMMLRNIPLFKALDADEDGQLSASEIENASKSILKLDKNGDGLVSAEEMRPDPGQMPMFAGPNGPNGPGRPGAPGAPGPEIMARMFENRDQDKDGKLSGDEIPPQMRERLSNMDTNGDGAIDKSELEQAMRRLEEMRPGNRRPEGRPEGRTEGGE
ncbi:MAG: EF-hand domain-containing protein, partial [Pirellula sp.]